ncbi:MAG: isoleucine--tRNA ligase [Candidatus Binatia bacterium]
MRASLPQNEPLQVEKWQRDRTYFKILDGNKGKRKYILHDGPPYANGNIHLGHALNKILKDIIVKYKNMTGFFAPYIPGWDCHGLPIELQVEKNIGRAKKRRLSKAEVRRLCREYAERYISIQREEFKRLGVLGDWDHPYRTIDYPYEAAEIRELGKFIAAGSLYRQRKPVYWCPSCATALAEAEVEYEEHTSPSIFVKFPVKDTKGKFASDAVRGAYFVIWTTTPWTLPANQAIAVHPQLTYRLVRTRAGNLIVTQDLVTPLMKTFGLGNGGCEEADTWVGQDLEGVLCRHPWIDREVKVILGGFVTKDQGTGCVHIAPGHGQEDYEVGQRYGLEVSAPIDSEGRFTPEAGDLAGESVFKADRKIVDKLRAKDLLLKEEKLTHSYPHCWRCKNPVIFRATEQWFISMERNNLRRQALEAINQVTWIPHWGRERIRGMLESRPDWCISRQRSWGVPIPVFFCNQCHRAHLSQELCEHIGSIFMQEGSDSWFTRPASALIPPKFRCAGCGGKDFSKEENILDVWFDSGVSHAAMVEPHPELGGIADLYLEGSDQHRGWFHTSLLTAVGTRGGAPYQNVLTHGFTLDGIGRKMSKSLGNVIAPQEIIKSFGAEILRLWTSAEDYRDDVRISKEIINRLAEAYRKLRNTPRFLLGNLYDFDPEKDAVEPAALAELDRWILHQCQWVLLRCREAYERFEFHIVYHTLNNFCSVDLSALYLDIVKDRLYCCGATSKERRSAQTALYRILEMLVHLMAPILSFTAEEIWEYMPRKNDRLESVFLSQMPRPENALMDEELGAKWEQIFRLRGEILKGLEVARNRNLIGHSLDARVVLYPDTYTRDPSLAALLKGYEKNWPEILIVSQVELQKGEPAPELRETNYAAKAEGDAWVSIPGRGESSEVRHEGISYRSALLGGPIAIYQADGRKCHRCWNYSVSVGKDPSSTLVCPRCSEVLRAAIPS